MKTTTAATANPTIRTTNTTRTIVCVGMLAAISTILMLFEFPLPLSHRDFMSWISVRCRL
mgnify:CR=1 FL=1